MATKKIAFYAMGDTRSVKGSNAITFEPSAAADAAGPGRGVHLGWAAGQ